MMKQSLGEFCAVFAQQAPLYVERRNRKAVIYIADQLTRRHGLNHEGVLIVFESWGVKREEVERLFVAPKFGPEVRA